MTKHLPFEEKKGSRIDRRGFLQDLKSVPLWGGGKLKLMPLQVREETLSSSQASSLLKIPRTPAQGMPKGSLNFESWGYLYGSLGLQACA